MSSNNQTISFSILLCLIKMCKFDKSCLHLNLLESWTAWVQLCVICCCSVHCWNSSYPTPRFRTHSVAGQPLFECLSLKEHLFCCFCGHISMCHFVFLFFFIVFGPSEVIHILPKSLSLVMIVSLVSITDKHSSEICLEIIQKKAPYNIKPCVLGFALVSS